FIQAADGIRDPLVTGVQTCALPISADIEECRRAGHPPPPAGPEVDRKMRFACAPYLRNEPSTRVSPGLSNNPRRRSPASRAAYKIGRASGRGRGEGWGRGAGGMDPR